MVADNNSDDGIRVFYSDADGIPIVTVANLTHGRERLVDVVRSLECDPSNIGHPLIVATIIECTDAIRLQRKPSQSDPFHPDQQIAERWLASIFAALLSGAKKRGKEDDERRAAEEAFEAIHDGYFADLWTLLNDPSVSSESPHRKIELVEEWQMKWSRIDEQYDLRNREVIEFLNEIFFPSGRSTNDPLELPKRGGRNALRNLFFGWKQRCGVAQAKNRFSAAIGYMRRAVESNSYEPLGWGGVTEAETEAFIERFFGMNVIAPTVEESLDTSRLVFIDPA